MEISQGKIPVTTIVRVKPKKGFEKQTLDWFHSISETASHFSGHLDSEVFETVYETPQKEIVNIFRFDTYENLMAWENSIERHKQLEAGKAFFEQVNEKQLLTGLEFWFEGKNSRVNKAPAKWKMMVVTTIIIFVLLNTLIPLLSKLFLMIDFPRLLTSLFSVMILVSLMTYFIMPFFTKVFSKWLFKP